MKTSRRKLEANRRNAQKSCGPKSAEGKAASSRNAVRHGLSSGDLTILPNESKERLDQLIAEIEAEFKPASKSEQFLADQMIHARWKLLRVRRLEAEALDRVAESDDPNPDRRILSALETPGNILDKLARYTAQAECAYSKAVRDLAQLRANAAKLEKQNKANEAQKWMAEGLARCRDRIYPPLPLPFEEPEQTQPAHHPDSVWLTAAAHAAPAGPQS